MNSVGKNTALHIAEQIMDFHYEQQRQEHLRRYEYIQQKKEMRYSRRLVTMLSLIAVVIVLMCSTIVTLEMQIRERENRLSALKVEVAELKKENQEAEKRLSRGDDYDWVRQKALQLGMTAITADKVIYYSVEDTDFMEQYENIPTS